MVPIIIILLSAWIHWLFFSWLYHFGILQISSLNWSWHWQHPPLARCSVALSSQSPEGSHAWVLTSHFRDATFGLSGQQKLFWLIGFDLKSGFLSMSLHVTSCLNLSVLLFNASVRVRNRKWNDAVTIKFFSYLLPLSFQGIWQEKNEIHKHMRKTFEALSL